MEQRSRPSVVNRPAELVAQTADWAEAHVVTVCLRMNLVRQLTRRSQDLRHRSEQLALQLLGFQKADALTERPIGRQLWPAGESCARRHSARLQACVWQVSRGRKVPPSFVAAKLRSSTPLETPLGNVRECTAPQQCWSSPCPAGHRPPP